MKMAAGPLERTLIGLGVRVISSAHQNDADLAGTVVDETRDTIVIDETARRRIRKKGIVLEVDVRGTRIRLKGVDLAGLPEERIKRIR